MAEKLAYLKNGAVREVFSGTIYDYRGDVWIIMQAKLLIGL